MDFRKNTVLVLCENLFIILLFFEIKKITLCDEPSNFFRFFLCNKILFLCDEHHSPSEIPQNVKDTICPDQGLYKDH